MSASLLLGGLLLAAVLATAGVAKLLDLDGSRGAVAAFGVPPPLAGPLGTLLPVAELATAALLIVGVANGGVALIVGALSALALLVIFSVGIALSVARGQAPDCHCFGQLHSAPAGPGALARNGALLALAAFVSTGGDAIPTLVAGVAALALLGVTLARSRVSAAARAEQPPAEGRRVGTPAPGFRLRGVAGSTHTLGSLRARGLPVLLLFTDPGCGPCIELAPEVARWQRTHANRMTIAVVETGAERAGADEHGRTNILLQDGSEVADLYGAQGTPTAVLIEADGAIASAVAAGGEQIKALMARTVGGFQPQPTSTLPERPVLASRLRRRELVVGGAGSLAAIGAQLPSTAAARRALRPRPCDDNRDCWGRKICLRGQCAHPECDFHNDCPGDKPCVRGECLECHGDRGCRPWEVCEKTPAGPKCRCSKGKPDRCGDECTDTDDDHDNCGGCGREFACRGDEACVGGECVGGDGSVCPGGCDDQAICCQDSNDPTQARCVHPRFSPVHCGGCNQPCAYGDECCEGRCRDVQNDPENCKGCGKECPSDQVCVYEECRDRCPGALKRCRRRCVDAKSDPKNCGDCGIKCTGPFDTGECCNGNCCDYNAQACCPGGCTNTGLDEENCGACGNVCKPGEFCRFGECVCPLGQTCG